MCISLLQMHSAANFDKNTNLAVLLVKFFELYGRKFDYNETCINITDGKYFSKDEIRSGDFIGTGSDLCIRYPLTEDTMYLRPAHSTLNIKPAFECAYDSLSAAMSNCTQLMQQSSILDSIVRIPNDVIKYRNWIHDKFKYVLVYTQDLLYS